jgi:hypothetical protein
LLSPPLQQVVFPMQLSLSKSGRRCPRSPRVLCNIALCSLQCSINAWLSIRTHSQLLSTAHSFNIAANIMQLSNHMQEIHRHSLTKSLQSSKATPPTTPSHLDSHSQTAYGNLLSSPLQYIAGRLQVSRTRLSMSGDVDYVLVAPRVFCYIALFWSAM